MTTITATLSHSHTDNALLATNIKVDGKSFDRNHCNIRLNDIEPGASIKLGKYVSIKGKLTKYYHNGVWKTSITNITSIKSI